MRVLFEKNGGCLGTKGSASHNFQKMGVIKIDKNELDNEKILELAIEAGANECYSKKEYHEIQTNINEIYNIKKKLEKNITNFISTEIEWIPINLINLYGEDKNNMIKFLDELDDDDDVQNIFTNAELEN